MTALVEDDGEGFAPDAVRGDGLGLLGMRERVAPVDGRLTLESSPRAGTTVAVQVGVIRAVVVDDHAVVRSGIKLLLDVRTGSRSSARRAGRLSLGPSFVDLAGTTSDGRSTAVRIGFDEIAPVRYARGRLHLRPRKGPPLSLGSVDKPGALWELSAHLKTQVGGAAALW